MASRKFGFLVHPSANRSYAGDAPRLALAELAVMNATAFSDRLSELRIDIVAGLPYVTFRATEGLDAMIDPALLGRHSSVLALFEFGQDGRLDPFAVPHPESFEDDLLTIPKYAGKTNERFTRLMVNAALSAASGVTQDGGYPVVFDPMCGRGTTLLAALYLGCDAAGIEIEPRDFEAWERFIKTYLREKRLKHTAENHRTRDPRGRERAMLDISIGRTKAAWKEGEAFRLRFTTADARDAVSVYGKEKFTALVADLPYGVQHQAKSAHEKSRRPQFLVEEALPGWVGTVKRKGAIVLSWNTRMMARAELAKLMREAGLEVLDGAPWNQFSHKVDQTVARDLIVGVRG